MVVLHDALVLHARVKGGCGIAGQLAADNRRAGNITTHGLKQQAIINCNLAQRDELPKCRVAAGKVQHGKALNQGRENGGVVKDGVVVWVDTHTHRPLLGMPVGAPG